MNTARPDPHAQNDGTAPDASFAALTPTAASIASPLTQEPGIDFDTLQSLVERLNEKYRAALSYAYCPSSEPYKLALRDVRDINAGIEAYVSSVAQRLAPQSAASVASGGEADQS